MNMTIMGTYIARGALTTEIGMSLIAVTLILISIMAISNENENASRDRSEVALITAGILAIIGLLNGAIGIILLAVIALWAIVENIK